LTYLPILLKWGQSTKLKYYGISFFEIEAQGHRIIIDPCVTNNRLCPIKVADIDQADIILVTHGAKDHMGDAIDIQKATHATIVCDPAVKVHAIRNGVHEDKVISVLWGDLIQIGAVYIQAVECRHISFLASGDTYLSGLPLSFIVYPEEGTRIYNVGDSALFSDMKFFLTHNPITPILPLSKKASSYHLPLQDQSVNASLTADSSCHEGAFLVY
jgi:L-ascorbate metabolism protein UlaG (beta-lactamase superfamily)